MKSLILFAVLSSLAACNTFEGLGRDLAAGGDAITNAAEEAQNPQPQPTVYQQARPAPVYQQPAPVYQQPAPAYQQPAPIYQQQAPAAPQSTYY